MGLAASQARLLLLTARKSDLEYRAQCITNTEMVLAMQTEAVARKYSEAISNTAIFYTTSEGGRTVQQCLKSDNLAMLAIGYRLAFNQKDANGKYIEFSQDGSAPYFEVTSPIYQLDENNKEDPNTKPTYTAGMHISYTQYDLLTDEQKAKCKKGDNQYTNAYDETELLEMINNGTLVILDSNDEVISLSGNNKFTEAYYTDDDAAAEAEYKRETASIQVKEKRLQMELNQIEAQQKACDTEIESVKKVMDKNIERTFKVFS